MAEWMRGRPFDTDEVFLSAPPASTPDSRVKATNHALRSRLLVEATRICCTKANENARRRTNNVGYVIFPYFITEVKYWYYNSHLTWKFEAYVCAYENNTLLIILYLIVLHYI